MNSVRSLATLIVLSLCLTCPPVALAQVASDSILSRHIKEGDNLGQDTNSGNGIKTGHINNGAVTNAKLGAGAVTSDKISGPLPASLVDRSGLDADLLDGYHASAFAAASHTHTQYRAKNSRIIVVAADGSGDYTNVDAAMASIADASATNPYLIKVAPGDYQVPPIWSPKSYVDIEGSGRGITRIWAACPAQTIGPTLLGVAYVVAEIRDVTLEMVGGGTGTRYSAVNVQSSSLRLSRVAIVCGTSGGGVCEGALNVNYGAQVELVDSPSCRRASGSTSGRSRRIRRSPRSSGCVAARSMPRREASRLRALRTRSRRSTGPACSSPAPSWWGVRSRLPP